MVRRILQVAGGLVLILFVAAGGVWLWKPWKPPLEMVLPGDAGRRIAEAGVIANYYPASQSAPGAGVILLGGSEGGLGEGATRMALELQKSGLSVLQVAYYRGPGQPQNLELIPLDPVFAAIDWLAAQPEVDPNRLGIIGVSKGAEAALIVSARDQRLRAVVAGAPSSVVWTGINWDFGGAGSKPSWTISGKPLPALPYGAYDNSLGVLSVYSNGLAALSDHPDTAIPAEKVSGPILLVCGEDDTLWPSCPMARQLAGRAGERATLLAYADAGHAGIGVPVEIETLQKPELLASLGGTIDGNLNARRDSWPKIVTFLNTTLSSP